MNQQATNLARSATTAFIIPIAGLLGGLVLGGMRTIGWRPWNPIAPIASVVQWGVTGFFAGLALVVLLSVFSRRQDMISMRRLMVLVVVAGLIAWFFARIFSGLIGYEGF